ncbi:MAG TPA: hypothetical protein VMF62_19775 [Acetobacteraceae bacterium]|nr:hypothetical protein [Acetobacteraceae bacterium]
MLVIVGSGARLARAAGVAPASLQSMAVARADDRPCVRKETGAQQIKVKQTVAVGDPPE